jgi:hypothetical protein
MFGKYFNRFIYLSELYMTMENNIPTNTGKYHGTYPARNIGKGQTGIHLPAGTSGDFRIFVHFDGRIDLIPAERK